MCNGRCSFQPHGRVLRILLEALLRNRIHPFDPRFLLSLLLPLGLASHNLDLLRLKLLCVVIKFEIDVLDDKSPDLVAEPVHVEMSLSKEVSINAHLSIFYTPRYACAP